MPLRFDALITTKKAFNPNIMPNDSVLWDRIKRGDHDAFAEIYRRHFQSLFVYGYKISGEKDLTKDILHDLFFYLWENRKKLEIKSLGAYLRISLRNRLLAVLKTKVLFTSDLIDHLHDESYEDLLINLQDDIILKEKIRAALSKLTPKQLEIVKMKFFENKTYDEISEITNTNSRTIYNQVYESLKILRKYISYILFVLIASIKFF